MQQLAVIVVCTSRGNQAVGTGYGGATLTVCHLLLARYSLTAHDLQGLYLLATMLSTGLVSWWSGLSCRHLDLNSAARSQSREERSRSHDDDTSYNSCLLGFFFGKPCGIRFSQYCSESDSMVPLAAQAIVLLVVPAVVSCFQALPNHHRHFPCQSSSLKH